MHRVRWTALTLWLLSGCLFSCSSTPAPAVRLAPHPSGPHEIRGQVWGSRVGMTDAAFDCYEQVLKNTPLDDREVYNKTATQAFYELFGVNGATVQLWTSDKCIRQTVSDAGGRFRFQDVPNGRYLLAASNHGLLPSDSDKPDEWVLTRRFSIKDRDIDISLTRPNPLIALTGRVLGPEGRPITGARITGTPAPGREAGPEPSYSAVSDSDGVYQLQRIPPLGVYRAAGYLNGGSLTAHDQTDGLIRLRVEADGYTQVKEDIHPWIPLISENVLITARRLHQAMGIGIRRMDPERVWEQKAGVYLPESRGDTIIGIDLVMQPVDTPARRGNRE